MEARQILNRAYVNGAVVCGAIVGLVTESWGWFTLICLACLIGSYYGGEIRTDGKRRRLIGRCSRRAVRIARRFRAGAAVFVRSLLLFATSLRPDGLVG